jgi:hypothetical protein
MMALMPVNCWKKGICGQQRTPFQAHLKHNSQPRYLLLAVHMPKRMHQQAALYALHCGRPCAGGQWAHQDGDDELGAVLALQQRGVRVAAHLLGGLRRLWGRATH